MYNVVLSFGTFETFDEAHDLSKQTLNLLQEYGLTAKAQVYEYNPKPRYNTDIN
jgi:hypothetical protein